MKAEIISIGSELVSGQCLDTNSQWLSTRLAEVGVPVHFHTTVGDDLADNVAAFRTASQRADLVLLTGGLGPTQDDLTREAMAERAGVPLEFHAPSLEHIQKLFARRGRDMPERNRVQAYFPAGSQPMDNPDGTAPGIWMQLPRAADGHAGTCTLVAMPGVPSEMRRMFQHEVLPRLRGMLQRDGDASRKVLLHRRIHCFGLGESAVEEKLMDLTRRGRQPEVGITVHEATITLRITAQGPSAEACQAAIEPTARIIYERLGRHVFGEEDEELQDALGKLLRGNGLTLATAELGTDGLVAHRLSGVAGLEGHYRGGVVARSEQAVFDLLEVSPRLIEMAGSISREAVAAMAVGCRLRLGAKLGLAVSSGQAAAPTDTAPLAFVALSTAGSLHVEEHSVGGDPAIVQSRTAKVALNLARLHLLGQVS